MTWLLPGSFIVSLVLTGALRRYALARQILDIPNHRSSHTVPTPRGGGLAFVFCFLAIIIFLHASHVIKLSLAGAVVGSGFLIAAIGFIDDKHSISAYFRLLAHFAASIFAIACLGGMPAIVFFNGILISGIIINVFAVFYLVWLLNLYNFMDGIDGLAAVQAISVCFGGAVLYWLTGAFDQAFLLLVLAFSVGGFLFWNFPRARIFMGDTGSGFLGIVLGILSIHAATVNAQYFWSWLILLGVFIVDATVTLLRRALRGKKLSEAHCAHAYQHASRYFKSHSFVSFVVFLINCLWLMPIAILVGKNVLNGLIGLMIAYLPLVFACFYFDAGTAAEYTRDLSKTA